MVIVLVTRSGRHDYIWLPVLSVLRLTVDTGERAVSSLSFDVKLTTSLQEEKIWTPVAHAIDKCSGTSSGETAVNKINYYA